MEGEEVVFTNGGNDDQQQQQGINLEKGSKMVDIYPLNRYYFGSKDALSIKHPTLLRFKSNYQAHGLRTCVDAVILRSFCSITADPTIELRYTLPRSDGWCCVMNDGRVNSVSDVQGLSRKLSKKLSSVDEGSDDEIDCEVGECLGMWWRPDLFYPYLPPNIKHPKLPVSRKFIVPKNLKLLVVPFSQVHDNHKAYGPIIAGIPQLLSRYSFNMIET